MTAKETRGLAIGSLVFCTVSAVQGWYRVTAIRPRDGYIKIDGFGTWNPPHNFTPNTEVRQNLDTANRAIDNILNAIDGEKR
jgi:hypothetical protein